MSKAKTLSLFQYLMRPRFQKSMATFPNSIDTQSKYEEFRRRRRALPTGAQAWGRHLKAAVPEGAPCQQMPSASTSSITSQRRCTAWTHVEHQTLAETLCCLSSHLRNGSRNST